MALGCCCNCRVTLPEVDVWENATKVAAWPGNADQTPIAPYARAWGVLQDGSCMLAGDEPNATCGKNDGTQGVCYDMSFDGTGLSSNPLALPGGVQPCSGGAGDMVSQVIQNCFRKTGAKTNFSHACVGGWKGVAAFREWPGRYGFVRGPVCDCATDTDLKQQWKYSTIAHRESASYTLARHNIVLEGGVPTEVDTTLSYSHAFMQTATVDSFGNVTRTGFINSSRSDTGDPSYDGTDNCAGVFASGVLPDASFPGYKPGVPAGPSGGGASCGVITWEGSSGTAEELTALALMTPAANYDGRDEETGWGLEFIRGDFQPAVFSLSDSKLEISYRGSCQVRSTSEYGTETWDYSWNFLLVIELSGQHTFQAAMEDCVALLDEWPLHDDAVYPWRTDSKSWLMPYVRRNATSAEPTINWTVDEGCQFLNEGDYDGSVLGSPLPAGYSGYFNFNHTTWTRGPNFFNTGCSICEASLGAAQAAPLPATATNWTDYNEGASMTGPGAHVEQWTNNLYSDNGTTGPITGVRMVKWAETLEKWPSTNFFRPFGDDRWRMDMGNSSCIDAVDTGTKTLTLLDEITVSAGDLVVIYGGADYPDQIWSVSSYSHPSLVLGTQFDPTPAGTVETLVAVSREEWAEAGQWGEFGKVGKLRWQYSRDGAQWPWPRVTGKDLAITVDGVDTYKITLPENNIVSGDKVTVWNGGSQVGGTLYFKRITDTTGELYTDAAFATTQDATGATLLRGYEASPPEQSWNTDASRNTVVLSQFDSQFREADADPMVPSYAETHSQLALSRSNSRQCVFCASPNSQDTDYFSGNGSGSVVVTWDAGRISADMCHGEVWHARITQHMPDPLWQSPSQTCDAAISQESAPCAGGESTYKYYPIVEPLLASALPAGSPTIPGSPNWLDTGSAPSAVGIDGISAGCPVEPRQRGTIHAVREAWESCQNQKDQRNSGL